MRRCRPAARRLRSEKSQSSARATLGRFLGIAKVDDRLAFRPKNFAMLVRILRQHTTAGRRDFEAAHHMAVTIGAANQAKVHLGRGRQGANDSLVVLCPTRMPEKPDTVPNSRQPTRPAVRDA